MSPVHSTAWPRKATRIATTMTSVRLSLRSSSDSILSQPGSEIPWWTNSWYRPAEMTNRTVPIRKMSMIATVSAMSDLAAADDTSRARMRSRMTATTRSRPKTWSVADDANVPSTARMMRNRLVPRMSRITIDRSYGISRVAGGSDGPRLQGV